MSCSNPMGHVAGDWEPLSLVLKCKRCIYCGVALVTIPVKEKT